MRKEALIVPNPDDVLLGRTANVFHHRGNQRYRHLIMLSLPKFKKLESKSMKAVFKQQLTGEILDGGRVRFLRRDKKGKWRSIPRAAVVEKVSHALRDGIAKSSFDQKIEEMAKDFDRCDNTPASILARQEKGSQQKAASRSQNKQPKHGLKASGRLSRLERAKKVTAKTLNKTSQKAKLQHQVLARGSFLNLTGMKAFEELKARSALSAYIELQKQLQAREDALLFLLGVNSNISVYDTRLVEHQSF